APALAGESRHQLEIAPRRCIDLHHRMGRDAARRLEMRRPPLLRQGYIVDEGAASGEFGPAESAKAIEGADAIIILKPAAPGGALEARVGERRQRRLPLGEELEQVWAGQHALR